MIVKEDDQAEHVTQNTRIKYDSYEYMMRVTSAHTHTWIRLCIKMWSRVCTSFFCMWGPLVAISVLMRNKADILGIYVE